MLENAQFTNHTSQWRSTKINMFLRYDLVHISIFHFSWVLGSFLSNWFPGWPLKCRTIKDRPKDPAKWDEIADVVSALSIPVIANGDVFEYEDFKRIKDATGLYVKFIFYALIISLLYFW